MTLPITLLEAWRRERLLLLWGALPFPLAARPPANRALTLNHWAAEAAALPPPTLPLPQLPPLPLLSLDPSGRLERAFVGAGVPLQVVHTRRDAPAQDRHVLFKLAGDLARREGLVLSRMELRELRTDPDKSYLLDEAHRLAGDGALLLLGCDPAAEDFRAWWSALAPALGRPALFALGEPLAAWPEGAVCLGPDFAVLKDALWAAQPEPEATAPLAPDRPAVAEQPPPQTAGPVYNIHIHQASGLAIGDRAQVVQGSSPSGDLSPTGRPPVAPGAGPEGSPADEPGDQIPPLRQQLDAVFTAEALTIFCFDHFPAVYKRFSAGMSKRQKIHRLVKYCESQGGVNELQSYLQARPPARQQRQETGWEASPPPQAEPPRASADQRCADLEDNIREILALIKDYEDQRRLADDPKAKRRAEREIADLRQQLSAYQTEARELGCAET